MKRSFFRIGLYVLLIVSTSVFIKTVSAYFVDSDIYIKPPSHPQLQAKIFPIDSLVSISSETAINHKQKFKIVSLVSEKCPYCTNYLENISQLDDYLSAAYEFIPAFNSQKVSDTYLSQIGFVYPIYSGLGVSIMKEIKLVPTLLFLNKENEIIYSIVGPPSNKEELEKLLASVLKLQEAN